MMVYCLFKVAQLEEHLPSKQDVGSSNPGLADHSYHLSAKRLCKTNKRLMLDVKLTLFFLITVV